VTDGNLLIVVARQPYIMPTFCFYFTKFILKEMSSIQAFLYTLQTEALK